MKKQLFYAALVLLGLCIGSLCGCSTVNGKPINVTFQSVDVTDVVFPSFYATRY